MTALPAAELADVRRDLLALVGERQRQDLCREGNVLRGAMKRYAALMRGWVGKTAAACPLLLWNPIPFQYFTPEPGNQMIRECEL